MAFKIKIKLKYWRTKYSSREKKGKGTKRNWYWSFNIIDEIPIQDFNITKIKS